MRLPSYYVLTKSHEILRHSADVIHAIWLGRRAVEPIIANSSLRLISVQCGPRLNPIDICLTRVRLSERRVTPYSIESLQRAAAALPPTVPVLLSEDCDHPATSNVAGLTEVLYQLAGWPSPASLRRMLALCLDVPAAELPEFRVGMPIRPEHRIDQLRNDGALSRAAEIL